MAWIYLFVAGLLEIVWAISLKYADGFRRPGPSVVAVLAYAASLVVLALALRSIPAGTAYAVWVGIGAVGVALIGLFLLGEPATPLRLISLLLIVVGTLGLFLSERASG
jgi:quaternary ammonium compound-resistance protein SugE